MNTNKDKEFKNKNGEIIKIKADKDKLFTATMPYSLETIRAFDDEFDDNKIIHNGLKEEILDCNLKVVTEDYKGLLYTKLFINFKFSKALFDEYEEIDEETGEIITKTNKINKKKLRKMIYTSKVIIDDEEYCFFKRGGSKARTANVIFCKSRYKDQLYNPCLLGLNFEENEECDLTSKEAYTSLIMSGIVDTINISNDEILIIDDIISPKFKALQTITTLEGQQEAIEVEVKNNMTDGQALGDESLFEQIELLKDKTCALLRNDFTKSNVLRTKLQCHFKENNITKVYDKYRGWIDSSKIKLVITPSSCKYLKFKDQFNSEKDCYLDWLKRLPKKFGIVKTNHVGNYGKSYPLSYQMINSMNLLKEEVRELMKDELTYLKLLKDNTLITNEELNKMSKNQKKENRRIRNNMSYFLNHLGNTDELSTGDMINTLLNKNKDYRLTKDFKKYKSNQIQLYIENLRLGKIRIQNSLYSIMISCPHSMLKATYNIKLDKSDFIMTGNECYCPYFKDKEELMSIRNPQINAGNVNYMINKYHDEYKLFGYWENDIPNFDEVVFVNTYDFDVMNKLQGADFDIDTTYLTNNSLLVKKAKENQVWATPVNGIEGNKESRKYSNKSLAELDSYLGQSTMNIGKIVNKSAIFNAYMYDGMNNNKSDDYIQACYNASSSLSSYSQIAIDMAKKSFIDETGKPLSLNKLMIKLNKTYFINENKEKEFILRYEFDMKNEEDIELNKLIKDEIEYRKNNNYDKKYIPLETISDKLIEEYGTDIEIFNSLPKEKQKISSMLNKYLIKEKSYCKKMIVPYFFKYTAQDNLYRIPTYMDCGMDYLEQILDEFDTKAMGTDSKKICDLLISQRNLAGRKANLDKIDGVRKIITNCNMSLIKNYYSPSDEKEESKRKNNLRKISKRKAIYELKEKKLNKKTIYRILLRVFNLDNTYKSQEIKMLDKSNNKISYVDKKDNIKKYILAKELSELKSLTLTLIYNSYPSEFIECFHENKLEQNKNIPRFWA